MSLGLVLCACGSKPTPKPPPAELEITGPASFAGVWVADDDMSFGYRLEIGADGAYRQVTDRGKLSKCEMKGTLVAGVDARHYTIPAAQVTCDGPAASAAIEIAITSFTSEHLVVQTSTGGDAQARTYTRAPTN